MDPVAFTAKGVGAAVLEDLNTHVVVVAEDPDGDGGAKLEISRSLTHTPQDRELGHDTYCLCVNSGPTVYGGMLAYRLEGSILSIELDERAERELGIDSDFSILLDVDQAAIEAVRTALASILREVDAMA